MQAPDQVPWALLLNKLQRSDHFLLRETEFAEHGIEPDRLIAKGLLGAGGAADYEPPGCEQSCSPIFDFESRRAEGLFGVGCPYEPACWHGLRWFDGREMHLYRGSANRILPRLGALNGLEPLAVEVPAPFVSVGLIRKRGLVLPVVWARPSATAFEPLCLGLQQTLRGDGLVVLIPSAHGLPRVVDSRVILYSVQSASAPRLRLEEALDLLTPDYRRRVLEDATLDLDFVHLEFGSIAGERHVVRVNGQLLDSFRTSDMKFLRLLLLAAARVQGSNGGWLPRAELLAEKGRDKGIDEVRDALDAEPITTVSAKELRAVIRTGTRDGRVRLGVPPENIRIDESIREYRPLASSANRRREGGSAKLSPSQKKGARQAAQLEDACRALGVALPRDIARK